MSDRADAPAVRLVEPTCRPQGPFETPVHGIRKMLDAHAPADIIAALIDCYEIAARKALMAGNYEVAECARADAEQCRQLIGKMSRASLYPFKPSA